MIFLLPKLDFDFSELSNILSVKSLNIHYNILHKGYVDKINFLLTDSMSTTLNFSKNNSDILILLEKLKYSLVNSFSAKNLSISSLRSASLGYFNHSIFWKILTTTQTDIQNIYGSNFMVQISKDFGSTDNFINNIIEISNKQFSNGWCWLIWDSVNEKLILKTLGGHENPMFRVRTNLENNRVIACFDLWEHAYIMDFGLKDLKKGFLKTILNNIINWSRISKFFDEIKNFSSQQNVEFLNSFRNTFL